MSDSKDSTQKPAKKPKIAYAGTKKIQTVQEDLGVRIKNGEWKEEEYLPSQSRLAKHYGVSQGAIAIAMRALQKEGFLQLVPGRGAFVPPKDARGERQVMPMIGIRGSYIPPTISPLDLYEGFKQGSPYNLAMLQAVWASAQQKGCPIVLLPNSQGSPLTLPMAQTLGIRGAIYLGGESYEEASELRMSGFPVITVNPPHGPTSMSYVEHDHVDCLTGAMSRMIELGHRRIAVLLPTTSMPRSYDRLKPYFIETLCAAGIVYNFDQYWRIAPHSSLGLETNHIEVIESLFELPEPPTAIFAFGGFYVPAVYELLEKKGLSIPRDVSLVYAPYSPNVIPPTSGYMPSFDVMAQNVIEGLLEMIKRPFYSIQKMVPLSDLIDRGTLASVASDRAYKNV